jgi:hypothetical protein
VFYILEKRGRPLPSWPGRFYRRSQRAGAALRAAGLRVREVSIYFDFVAFYYTAHNRKLRKVPREFFEL